MNPPSGPLRHALLLLLALAVAAGCRTESTNVTAPAAEAPADGLSAALAAIDTTTLYRHMATLAADSMEGRGTGTPGEERAVNYIRAEMERIGLEGGAPGGGFFQAVPLRGKTPQNVSDLRLRSARGEEAVFAFFDDFILSSERPDTRAALDGELVFVGYGISNPGYDWDDYKDVDVAGRILVGFVNEPPATAEEPGLFQADTLTYNGRWTYKYEEARRRGARGMFLIHTDEMAGYGFQVLQGSARGEHVMLDAPLENALALRGWITQPTAERLARMAGTTLEAWKAAAARRDFRPQPLGVSAQVEATFTARTFTGTNVIGVLRGRDRQDEGVLYTAHHDHLGMRDGEIYNGAVDNAAGVAKLLAIAEGFARLAERPRRSVYFATVTAEENGLLGSAYLAQNPPIAAAGLIANINLDAGNLYGETEDIVGIGAERSELMRYFRQAAEDEGLTVSPDAQPGQGFFFRSDQLSFAREGVPGVFVNTGTRFVGQPASYADSVFAAYNRDRYHQPDDVMHEGMRFGGLAQQARVALRLGHRLADSDARPAWNDAEPFAETRRRSEGRD
ncbi:MAG: M28 family peptidase [Rubricoccaceae bacterium]